MLTGKQRSYLKGLAHHENAVVFIGKDGLTESTIAEMNRCLESRELIKVKIQDNAYLDAKETANHAAEILEAEFVQAIGSKFSLYRKAGDPEKRKIVLPK